MQQIIQLKKFIFDYHDNEKKINKIIILLNFSSYKDLSY